PQRFPREIGVITGIVGAAGGLGGFLLPTLLGGLRQWTHSYGVGFLTFALAATTGATALAFVGRSWEGGFLGKGGVRLARPAPRGADGAGGVPTVPAGPAFGVE